MSSPTLNGLGVLVTRPRRQSAELVAEIERRGGRAILFPSIDIVARDRQRIAADLDKLSTADISVFISSNAVEHGVDYAEGEIAAIGPATATAIERAGKIVSIQSATGFDSEHLLAEPAFGDLDGRTVRIIRGDAGRELLAETLRQRGANVEYLTTYERRLPHYPQNVLDDLEKSWRNGDVNAVIVMSVQSLVNLYSLLPEWCAKQLPGTPLVTPAARVLKEALKRAPGCTVILANGPQASAIADCLAAVRPTRHSANPGPE